MVRFSEIQQFPDFLDLFPRIFRTICPRFENFEIFGRMVSAHCLDLPTYLSLIGSLISDVFGSLGSQGEHCLDLPTYLSFIESLATCLVRLVLG